MASALQRSSASGPPRGGVLARYADFLPLTSRTPIIDLGEGSTPLVRSRHIGPSLGIDELYFKLESCNPTGSFKDRGMVVADRQGHGSRERGPCSAPRRATPAPPRPPTRPTAALQAYVFLPKGSVAMGKLAQSVAYGAQIVAIDGNFDDALRLAREFTQKHPVALVNSVNPYRIAGQKTAAFEIVDDLGEAPDHLFIPVGNAGNITAYWAGFQEYAERGQSVRLPKMMGFQAAGAAPIVLGPARSRTRRPSRRRSASATPRAGSNAVAARDESGGAIDSVTDEEILDAYGRLAREEGIFCEPASAASVAGLIKAVKTQPGIAGGACVCIITGHGLKDPDTAESLQGQQFESPARLDAIEAVLGFATSR